MAELVERVANLEARFDAQVVQLNGIQESVVRLEDKMERRFEGVDQRFQAADQRFQALEDKMERRFETLERRMDDGFAVVRTEFRWIIGAIAGAAVTVIVTILGALFAKDVIGLP